MDQISKTLLEILDESLPTISSNNAGGSISSRVRASASGLFGEFLTRPSSYDEVSTVASISESGNKGSSTSTLVNGSPSFQNNISLSAHAHNEEHRTSLPPNWDLFRPNKRNDAGYENGLESDFENFVVSSRAGPGLIQDFPPFEDYANPSHQEFGPCTVREGKRRAISPHKSTSRRIIEESVELPNNEPDGAAVVALLCESTSSLSQMPESLEWEGHGDHQEIPQPHLTLKSCTYPSVPLSALSLLPSFNESKNNVEIDQALCKICFVTSPGQEFSDTRRLPWIDMIDSYHDQVWDDIPSLLQDSHPKVQGTEEISKSDSMEGPAAKRLAMILGHIGHLNTQILALPPI